MNSFVFFLLLAIATTCNGATGNTIQSSLPLAAGIPSSSSIHKVNALPPVSLTTTNGIVDDHQHKGLMHEVRTHSRGGPVWFAVGQVLAVASAYFFPKMGCTGGYLHLDTIVGQFGVLIIFFLNGLSLSPNQLKTASSHWKINLLTQLYNQLLIPFMVGTLIAPQIIHPGYRDGIICLAALPCTVHLSTTIAQAAGGSVATAILNSLVSNVMGAMVTPLVVAWMMNEMGTGGGGPTAAAGGNTGLGFNFDVISTLKSLFLLVVVPTIAGVLARATPLRTLPDHHALGCRLAADVLLLLMAQQTFSDGFLQKRQSSSGAAAILGINTNSNGNALLYLVALLPLFYMTITGAFWWISGRTILVGRTTVDIRARVAATICSSQKSLAFGIPFIKATFSHRHDQADIMVPLLLFAQIQLITCVTVFVPIFKHLIVKHELAHHHLVSDTELAEDRREASKWVVTSAESTTRFLTFLKSSLLHGSLRSILTTLCFVGIVMELCDDIIDELKLPFFSAMKGRVKMQHTGMLMLTVSHLLGHMSDIVQNWEYTENNQRTALQNEFITSLLLNQSFTNEQEAARAYDRAAVLVYGRGTAQNFHDQQFQDFAISEDADEEAWARHVILMKETTAKRPTRYRGIHWDEEGKVWRVSGNALGLGP